MTAYKTANKLQRNTTQFSFWVALADLNADGHTEKPYWCWFSIVACYSKQVTEKQQCVTYTRLQGTI
jgi:hypothetical protein